MCWRETCQVCLFRSQSASAAETSASLPWIVDCDKWQDKQEQDYKVLHRTVTPAPLNGNYFQFSPDSASTAAKTLFRGCPSPRSAVRLGRSALGILQVGDMMVHCAGCERPILDRFLLNVLDRAWHAKCVQCCECSCNLTEKCFSRDGKLYCKMDFFR